VQEEEDSAACSSAPLTPPRFAGTADAACQTVQTPTRRARLKSKLRKLKPKLRRIGSSGVVKAKTKIFDRIMKIFKKAQAADGGGGDWEGSGRGSTGSAASGTGMASGRGGGAGAGAGAGAGEATGKATAVVRKPSKGKVRTSLFASKAAEGKGSVEKPKGGRTTSSFGDW
jgi:hypothetical protein